MAINTETICELIKQETEDRFDKILAEMQRNREEQARQWDEQNRKWDEQNEKWHEQNRKWDEQNEKWHEQNRKWDEQNEKWHEQNQKWKENQKALVAQQHHTDKLIDKVERRLGAMGARWGTSSEESFRAALKGILETSFGVNVLNVNEFDDEGSVFGRPDQVELDIIIHNGTLILCELKSSMSKSEMYTFKRKAEFYQTKHQRQANRLIVISPMIDKRAQAIGEQLGIEMFSDSIEVEAL